MRIEAIADARRAYLDSNIFIYLVEGKDRLQDMAGLVLELAKSGGVQIVASELALAECLVGAHRIGDEDLERDYRTLLAPGDAFVLAPVVWPVLDLAAMIGRKSKLRLLDAIHVATALHAECDVFVTNDAGIRRRSDIEVVQLS